MVSNFSFLPPEWPELAQEAVKAEHYARRDPRTALFYARRTVELMVGWLYAAENIERPYKADFISLLHEPALKQLVDAKVWQKINVLRKAGNHAVHDSKPPAVTTAQYIIQELFHCCYWLARTYTRQEANLPSLSLQFDPALLAPASSVTAQASAEDLAKLSVQLEAKDAELSESAEANSALQAQIEELQTQVAAAKSRNERVPDKHDYDEALTRQHLIDLELQWAGWRLDRPEDREFQVDTMPAPDGRLVGVGYVDYVLWGADGLPLAVVEAKRTTKDPHVGKQQAKLYADALERRYGRRPVIVYTNGYRHWLWDDTAYPDREVSGFHTRDELQLMVDRRETRRPLADAQIDSSVVERGYQHQAIRAVTEAFEGQGERKALIVMATGAGKTRTVIALAKLLMEANWVKRVLFLADRVALVDQAARAFKAHLPGSGPVVLGRDTAADSRVHVATYPTIMNLINARADDGRVQQGFGVGHYDLVVIDEAHRSVYRKYRAIFEYFDSYLVGLTATPQSEVDRNTYSLFDIEDNVPTFAYELPEAVAAGYLVPPRAVQVPLRFPTRGIRYDELSEDEKEQWDSLEWDNDGEIPSAVDPAVVNSWLFNTDTVNKVLETLMERGHKVQGGDRIGKTIIFAKNNRHAEFIAEQFDKNYPQFKGHLARVVTYQTEYAGTLIDAFARKDDHPRIVISVDMLDTGIDVPEVVNLVFFKPVRSKTKFWQMVGRGTRLCPDLYGPGQSKEDFFIFDVCGNVEFFNARLQGNEGSLGKSLGEALFASRVALLRATIAAGLPEDDPLRADLANRLRTQVVRLPHSNFLVRRHLEHVERFAVPQPWRQLSEADADLLERTIASVAGLGEDGKDTEEAKRFDLLMLMTQLASWGGAGALETFRGQVQEVAAALRDQPNIPAIATQMPLIEALLDPHEWESVDVHWLEDARVKLRGLVRLIEKKRRKVVYSNFEDQFGDVEEVGLGGIVSPNGSLERYREKARAYLRAHLDSATLQRLRRNKPLTELDLVELERMLTESGATPEDLEDTAERGLPAFVRSLVGLEREAVEEALTEFISDSSLSSRQLDFLRLIVDQLCENGSVSVGALYEPPFNDLAPTGPDELFGEARMDALVAALQRLDLPRKAG
ncbi:DEAD/DEAH box helicase family protein [Sinomonas sp. P47F7]|uniref:DEAD/DEAH box helicase family protein n=1 Tax=Sinomonas sp. P47F7 TaxID=3410987 RepID=UPI003BF603AC